MRRMLREEADMIADHQAFLPFTDHEPSIVDDLPGLPPVPAGSVGHPRPRLLPRREHLVCDATCSSAKTGVEHYGLDAGLLYQGYSATMLINGPGRNARPIKIKTPTLAWDLCMSAPGGCRDTRWGTIPDG